MQWRKVIVAMSGVAVPLALAPAQAEAADTTLAYETIEPMHIRLGETALLRVTSLDGYLGDIHMPSVPGLTFQMLGRSQGLELVNGRTIQASYILIRITPQMAGIYAIPGLTPKSPSLALDVLKADEADPYVFHGPDKAPKPLPVAPVRIPDGIQLRAGGAAFVQLMIPSRTIYVGQSVPVDIEVGLRPGIVTSLNGLPTLNGADFTLNNLSRHPKSTEQVIKDNHFEVMTWHSVLAAIKPGEFSLSAKTPLSVKITQQSDADLAIGNMLGWPFQQSAYNKITPRDMAIESPSSPLTVLPLPTEGRPAGFSGAVGQFQASAEITPAHVAAGEPLTLRMHIRGAGNFDRVDSTMFERLEHWKAYPARSAFTATNETGYEGDKVFEQPLIAAEPGEHTIPTLELSYFNPRTQRYERTGTQPMTVMIGAATADGTAGATMASAAFLRGLRPDHAQPRRSVGDLAPLYFRPAFLTLPAMLGLILAGSWLVIRPRPVHGLSKAARRALAELDAAAQSGDAPLFFEVARTAIQRSFAGRWRMSPGEITVAELRARCVPEVEDIERLWALADEAKYAGQGRPGADFPHWRGLIRSLLTSGVA